VLKRNTIPYFTLNVLAKEVRKATILKQMLHLYFKYLSLNKCCMFQYPTSVMSYQDKHVLMLQFQCQHL